MIEISHVHKTYGARQVLDDVSFRAEDGRVTGFVGPNGAGKSTLLRIIAGLTAPSSGATLVDGRQWCRADRPGETLGVFLDADWIPGGMTADSFLSYVFDLRGTRDRAVADVLSSVGLDGTEQRLVRTFSLGMRQRLGIAAAITAEPRNLILDEPVNGLDPVGIQWLRELVRSFARSGGAVLLSSHHMSELALVADDVIMLDAGRVVRSGTMRSFVATDAPATYLESPDHAAALAVLARHGMTSRPHGDGIVVDGGLPLDVGRVLFGEGPGVTHLRPFERSLDEAYFDELARQGALVDEAS